MIAIVKTIHIATISLWCAGLMALPFIYLQRQTAGQGDDLHRLHAFTRSFYVNLVSPAAFVAVGSGMALIFLQQAWAPWFIAKLAGVGVLVGLHIVAGLRILTLFEPNQRYGYVRALLGEGATILVTVAILTIVLGKPELSEPRWAGDIFRPGALREWVRSVTGWAI